MTKDEYPYSGTKHELGAAFAMRYLDKDEVKKPLVWIVANGDPSSDDPETLPSCLKSCFESLADKYFPSVEAVLHHHNCT